MIRIVYLAAPLSLAILICRAPADAQARADWTILVYINANNNLEPDAIDNYLQMEKVGSDDHVKVIVQFAILQVEIINFGQKIGASWEVISPLTIHSDKCIFPLYCCYPLWSSVSQTI